MQQRKTELYIIKLQLQIILPCADRHFRIRGLPTPALTEESEASPCLALIPTLLSLP